MRKISALVTIFTLFFSVYFSAFAADLNVTSTWTTTVDSVNAKSSGFVLKTVDVLWLNWIELSFSSPLVASQDSIREFKVVNKNDPLDSFEIVKTAINPNDNTKLLLLLDKDLEKLKEYEVTVLAIEDINGKNIESWIDSTEMFVVKEGNYTNINGELMYAWIQASTTNTTQELNTASWQELTAISTTAIPEQELKAASEVTESGNVLATAEKVEKLPTTWPENVLILVLSMLLWSMFFIFKFKKS